MNSVQAGPVAQQVQVLAANPDLPGIHLAEVNQFLQVGPPHVHSGTQVCTYAHMINMYIHKCEKNRKRTTNAPHRFCRCLKSMIACFVHKDSLSWLHGFETVPRICSEFGAETRQ